MKVRFSIWLGAAAAMVLFAIQPPASAGTNSWTSTGPPGGMFSFLVPSSTTTDVVYATYFRSLHKSIDGGQTWTRVRDFQGQVNALVVDPSDGNRILVSTNEQGIFRSDDGAVTFSQIVPAPILTTGIWGVGMSGTTIYFSNNAHQFYRSTNLGATWTLRSTTTQILTRVIVDPNNPDRVFGFSGISTARSVDGGATWLPSAGFVDNAVMLSATTLIGINSSGIVRSIDSGATWQVVAGISGFFRGIAADPNAPGTVIAASGVHQPRSWLYRTTDYGATWTQIGVAPHGPAEGLAISRRSSSELLVVSSTGARRSLDGGVTWAEVALPPIASSPHMASEASGSAKIYAYSLGVIGGSGELHSISGTGAWQRANIMAAQDLIGGAFGQTVLAVKPKAADTLYLAPFGNGIFRSIDGANSWEHMGFGLSNHAVTAIAFAPQNPDTMYAKIYLGATTPPSAFYRSTDGGMNWSPITTTLSTSLYSQVITVDPANDAHIFVGALGDGFGVGGLYTTLDGGVNWIQNLPAASVGAVAVDPANTNNVYVASSDGLQISRNGGVSYTPSASFAALGQGANSVVLDPVIPTTLYASGIGSQSASSVILRSVDSGLTWETLRSASDSPLWTSSQLVLDPRAPGIVYANSFDRGAMTFDVAPNLSVTLTGHAGQKVVGDPSTFDVRTTSAGPFIATAVQVVITLPTGVTGLTATPDQGSCTIANTTVTCMRTQQQASEVTNIHVAFTPSIPMLLPVTATVSAHEHDSAMSDNGAQAFAYAGDATDLSVMLTPSLATVAIGDAVTYSLVVRNLGPANLADSTVTITPGAGIVLGVRPSGCTFTTVFLCNTGALASGATRAFQILATATASGSTTTSASAAPAGSTVDPVATNNVATATVNVTAVSDVSVTVSDNRDPATAGTAFEYRVDVRNAGPDATSNIAVTLTADATVTSIVTPQGSCTTNLTGGTCSIATLGSNATATITVTAVSNTARTVALTATVLSSGFDPSMGNNSDQESTVVVAAPVPPPPPPPTDSGGKKGGGAFDTRWVLLLALLLTYRVRQRRTSRIPVRR